MSKNKLSIRATALDLDLSGESEYIDRAYDAIRPVLMERFAASIFEPKPPEVEGQRKKTLRLHTSESDEPKLEDRDSGAGDGSEEDELRHVNVVICNAVYHKIHLAEAEDLQSTIFGRALNLTQVHRIFINRSQRDSFREVLEDSKLLWRELTAQGKAAVKGSDS